MACRLKLFAIVLLGFAGAAAGNSSGQVQKAKNPGQVQEVKLNVTAEQVAEGAIVGTAPQGGRALLTQIRRNGLERGRSTRVLPDGRSEEDRYEIRFVRGDDASKDKVRIDHKTPQTEYSIVYSGGRMFGVINGSAFIPRAEVASSFLSDRAHSIDALLRYKENDSKLVLVGKNKQKGIEFYILDLTDKENHQTRYNISAKSLRVLWLEYEETPPGAAAPVKYIKKFNDYHLAQGIFVPFQTILYQDGKQTQETLISTITYGVKMDEALFQNPDNPTSTSNP